MRTLGEAFQVTKEIIDSTVISIHKGKVVNTEASVHVHLVDIKDMIHATEPEAASETTNKFGLIDLVRHFDSVSETDVHDGASNTHALVHPCKIRHFLSVAAHKTLLLTTNLHRH